MWLISPDSTAVRISGISPGTSLRCIAQVSADELELGVQILPFAHPQVVEVLVAAQPAELVAGQFTAFDLEVLQTARWP